MPFSPRPLEERFETKFTRGAANECWEWTGYKAKGYGQFMVKCLGRGRCILRGAHRVSYELAKGPIPEGLQLDHLCRNRACVNPDHLEPVTAKENQVRAGYGLRERCRKGHILEGNRYRRGDGLRCAECHREGARRRYAERKGK